MIQPRDWLQRHGSLLTQTLKNDGVYVGEVGLVKGTAFRALDPLRRELRDQLISRSHNRHT